MLESVEVRRIGPYRVTGTIGRGGMGVVYRARHATTDREVALKTVLLDRHELLSSMRREIRALLRVRHPSVVSVLDEGVEEGRPWYAMELVEGEPLHEHAAGLWSGHRSVDGAGSDEAARSTPYDATRPVDAPASPAPSTEPRRPPPMEPERVAPTAPLGAPTAVGLEGSCDPSAPTAARLDGSDAHRAGGAGARLGEPGSPFAAERHTPTPPEDPPEAAAGRLEHVLTLVRRLASALAALHAEGLVHRDLKPQNVIVQASGRPMLMDFGLASRVAGALGRERLELPPEAGGTPSYMAPEQVERAPGDARADIYALGVLLYGLLVGQPPFTAESDLELMQAHLETEPLPPSRLARGVPESLDRLVRGMLAKDPTARVAHAHDVARELDQLGARPDPDAGPERVRAYVYRPRLAGRTRPRDLLRATTERALRGAGECALIGGPSGIGKTCLAAEAASRASKSGMHVVTGTCVPTGGVGGGVLAPLQPFFRDVADRSVAEGAAWTDRVLGPRGKVLSTIAPMLARLPGQDAHPDPPELHGTAARDRLLTAVRDTLAAYAAEHPLMLVLDDLHWADELTMRLLTTLPSGWLDERRLLVVGTYRTNEATTGLSELLGRRHTRQVVLDRLDARAVEALAREMLAVETLPRPLVDFLVERSGGNPFFVAEYLRTAVAEGLLERRSPRSVRIGAAGEATGDAAAEGEVGVLPLPDSLDALVARRLDGLPEPARQLVEAASILGRDFDADLVHELTGLDEIDELEAFRTLLAEHVLEELRPDHYRFAHDKLWEVARARLDPERRRRLHAEAARAIERRRAADLAPFYAALAHHWSAAEVEDEALRYQDRAGEQAMARAAYQDAVGWFLEALARDDRRARQGRAVARTRRARWERYVSEALFSLGDLGGSEQHGRAALTAMGRSLPTSTLGWSGATAAQLALQVGRQLGLGRAAEDADREAPREMALAASQLAWCYFYVDDLLRVVGSAFLAVNESDRARPELPVASPYAWIGYTMGAFRMHGTARSFLDRALRHARTSGDVGTIATALLLESVYRFGLGDWEGVERADRTALELLRGAGDPQSVDMHQTMLANADFYTGRFRESVERFDRILASARARANDQHTAWGLYAAGQGLLAQGRVEEALPRLRQARRLLEQISDAASAIICDGLLAVAHLRRGEPREAVGMAEATRRRLRRSKAAVYSTLYGYMGALEAYVTVLEEGDDTGRRPRELIRSAREVLLLLRGFAFLFPFGRPALLLYRGRLQAATGHRWRAASTLRRAAEAAEGLGMPFEEAQARMALGRLGHAQELARAEAMLERLGASWHLARLAERRSPSANPDTRRIRARRGRPA